MSRFAITHAAVSVPKAGNRPAENEDAHAAAGGRFAVCDGASEGWASGAWAAALAAAFARQPPTPATFADWLAAARRSFSPPQSSAAWYAEAKQEQGAFATLLGLEIEPAKAGGLKWRAVAVGDSCLFQTRGGNLAGHFPVESVSDFSNRPALVGSSAASGGPEPGWFAGRAEVGDVFYLLTDALAEWALREEAEGRPPWAALDAAAGDFAAWVDGLRAGRAVKNDDCTLLRVGIDAA